MDFKNKVWHGLQGMQFWNAVEPKCRQSSLLIKRRWKPVYRAGPGIWPHFFSQHDIYQLWNVEQRIPLLARFGEVVRIITEQSSAKPSEFMCWCGKETLWGEVIFHYSWRHVRKRKRINISSLYNASEASETRSLISMTQNKSVSSLCSRFSNCTPREINAKIVFWKLKLATLALIPKKPPAM